MKGWIWPHRDNRTNCLQPEQMRDDAEAGPVLFPIWKIVSVRLFGRGTGARSGLLSDFGELQSILYPRFIEESWGPRGELLACASMGGEDRNESQKPPPHQNRYVAISARKLVDPDRGGFARSRLGALCIQRKSCDEPLFSHKAEAASGLPSS